MSPLRALAFLTSSALFFTVVIGAGSPSANDVTTYHNDTARTGQTLTETVLTPATVNMATFRKTGFLPTDGNVDAQPLYLSAVAVPGLGTPNVVYVVTEHDSVYAFNADTAALVWRVSLLGPGETTSDTRGCSQVTPEIGITATPVIDRSRGRSGALYVVAMSRDGAGHYFQRLHALDVATGAELFAGPTTIQAVFPSAGGTVVFDPQQYKERAALLLTNGRIITTWASHCDISPYTGWILAYDPATLAQTSVLNVTPNGSDGAIWMAGAGPAADAAGNVYLLDGNGTFDTALDGSGFPSRGDFGNAFLKISTGAGLAVADYFASSDTVQQSDADQDLGSGGAMVLPDVIDGSGAVRHLAVGAGKDTHLYVVDRDAMGKWNGAMNQIYQDVTGALAGGVFSAPAYFDHTVYVGGVDDGIKAFSVVNGRLSSTAVSRTAHAFGYPGAAPAISANGTANAILWAVENTNPAILHALDARDLSHELYASSQAPAGRDTVGPGNKFITPTIANGHVYVGTTNGVAMFGVVRVPSAPTGVHVAL
jgi:outer membrane protein assembly factor BamB